MISSRKLLAAHQKNSVGIHPVMVLLTDYFDPKFGIATQKIFVSTLKSVKTQHSLLNHFALIIYQKLVSRQNGTQSVRDDQVSSQNEFKI